MIIGVDLGGTNFKAGRISNGTVVEKSSHAVNATLSETELIDILFHTIDALVNEEITGIGVGIPGMVDPAAGVIYDIQNLPAWKKVQLKELLESRFAVPVELNNDANCFALGEHKFGKGQKYSNFVGVSVGTGLGTGVVIRNQLYSGVFCGAGEIGMVPFKDGIVEHYAGSFLFQKKYGQSAREIHENAGRNDPLALAAFEEFGGYLGDAIKIILLAYAPEAIILGGSISKAYSFFKEEMNRSLSQFAFGKQVEQLQIEVSTMADVAILGAGALCLE